MITITLTTALWLYGMAILALAVLLWGYTEWTGGRIRRALEKQSCWRCAYCGYVYLDEGMATYSTCPRCGSINVPAEGQDPLVSRKKALAAEASKTDAESLSDGEKQESRRNPARKKRPHAIRRGPRKRRGGS